MLWILMLSEVPPGDAERLIACGRAEYPLMNMSFRKFMRRDGLHRTGPCCGDC
ncbi:MAG: hypothetical protein MZV63_36000 [Marinilabiliales bacterium]|nr:hypothetical protein [Marinilabiliales bacterium]